MKLLLSLVILYLSLTNVCSAIKYIHEEYYDDKECTKLYSGEIYFENVCTLSGQTMSCNDDGSVEIQWYSRPNCEGPVAERKIRPAVCDPKEGNVITFNCYDSMKIPSNSFSQISTFQNICPTHEGDNSWAKYITGVNFQVTDVCFLRYRVDSPRLGSTVYNCNSTVAEYYKFTESNTCDLTTANEVTSEFSPCSNKTPLFTVCGNAFTNEQ